METTGIISVMQVWNVQVGDHISIYLGSLGGILSGEVTGVAQYAYQLKEEQWEYLKRVLPDEYRAASKADSKDEYYVMGGGSATSRLLFGNFRSTGVEPKNERADGKDGWGHVFLQNNRQVVAFNVSLGRSV